MSTTTTTRQTISDDDPNSNKTSSSDRYEVWHKREGEPAKMFERGAPADLVVAVLEVLAPMVEAQGANPAWTPPEYLIEITSHRCWGIVADWVTKIEDDIYSAERDGLI